jgi:hypothetical protein
MNQRSERDHNNKNCDSDRRSKSIAAIPMAGIIIAAALVSVPLFFVASRYPQAMAQQNNTTPSGVNGSTSTGEGNNTATVGGGDVQTSACAAIQTGGTFDEGVTVGGTSAFDDYDADSEGNGSVTTTGTTNAASTTTAGGGSQSTSDVRDYIEEACIALQVGDSQGAMMYMDMAQSALSGNDTQVNLAIPSSEITNGTTTGGDGVTTPAGSSAGTLSGGGT